MGELNKLNGDLYVNDTKLVQGIPYIELTRVEIEAISNPIKFQKVFDTDSNSVLTYNGSNWVTQTSNIKIIKSLSDFPTPVNNIITLEQGTAYQISGIVNIGANSIKFSDSTYLGSDSALTSYMLSTSSNALFIAEDASFSMESVTAITSGVLFDIKNLSRDKQFSIINCLLSYNDGGTIEGYKEVSLNFIKHIGLIYGIIFKDNFNISFQNQFYTEDSPEFHNYLSSDNVTVNVDESVLIVENYGIGTIGTVVKNISGSGILIDANTDYLNSDWENITRSLISFIDSGIGFNQFGIISCRFQLSKGYKGINLNNITPNYMSFIVDSSFVGHNLNISGIDVFDKSNNIRIHNNIGLPSPSIGVEMTSDERNSIINPKEGLYLFDTTEQKLSVYTTDGWTFLNSSISMTTIFEEDFESGSLTTNNWITVNDNKNQWVIGTADNNGGTYSVYISNDNGITPAYTNNTSNISHLYIDISIPSGITECTLDFDFKGEAELNYDYMRVYTAPTTYTPISGSLPSNSATLVGNSQYNNQSIFVTESIDIGTSYAGTNMRLIFTWKNDNSVGTNPATIIDNIKLKIK